MVPFFEHVLIPIRKLLVTAKVCMLLLYTWGYRAMLAVDVIQFLLKNFSLFSLSIDSGHGNSWKEDVCAKTEWLIRILVLLRGWKVGAWLPDLEPGLVSKEPVLAHFCFRFNILWSMDKNLLKSIKLRDLSLHIVSAQFHQLKVSSHIGDLLEKFPQHAETPLWCTHQCVLKLSWFMNYLFCYHETFSTWEHKACGNLDPCFLCYSHSHLI